MFGKRILNVEVYGDQTIYGIKTFKDKIVVPETTGRRADQRAIQLTDKIRNYWYQVKSR